MLRKVLFFGAGILFMSVFQACAQTPFSDGKIPDDLKISLSRSECFGMCPAYSLSINASGKIIFDGRRFTGTKGKAETKIEQETIKLILVEFGKAKFFGLGDRYATEKDGCKEEWTDHPSETISITANGKKKTVYHYFGCKKVAGNVLERIAELGKSIDRLTNSDRWVKGWKPS